MSDKNYINLRGLLSTFMVKLGFENATASSIIVQLLTRGKVRVDFSRVSQRMELVREEDQLTAPRRWPCSRISSRP